MEIKTWFECKVKVEKTLEGGATKKVQESYLVDALNFTEAEARIIKEMEPFYQHNIEVADIKKAKFSEMFPDDSDTADKWYKVKVNFITLDEKTATEKKTATLILVQAGNFHHALGNFDRGMNGTLADYEIESITETKIMDVYPYEAPDAQPAAKPEYEQ